MYLILLGFGFGFTASPFLTCPHHNTVEGAKYGIVQLSILLYDETVHNARTVQYPKKLSPTRSTFNSRPLETWKQRSRYSSVGASLRTLTSCAELVASRFVHVVECVSLGYIPTCNLLRAPTPRHEGHGIRNARCVVSVCVGHGCHLPLVVSGAVKFRTCRCWVYVSRELFQCEGRYKVHYVSFSSLMSYNRTKSETTFNRRSGLDWDLKSDKR